MYKISFLEFMLGIKHYIHYLQSNNYWFNFYLKLYVMP